MSGVFDAVVFLLIQDFIEAESSTSWVQDIIKRNGGRCICLTLDISHKALQENDISHIISPRYDFSGYSQALSMMIPITTPIWLEDSELASQKKNYRLYSPQPVPFMDKVVVCIANNLPEGDKEMMYAGVRAFGGQYLDSLSRYTTHLISLDLSNNKSVLAANIRKKENLKIQIVLPHWLDDCFKQQRRLDEKPYLLSDPVTLRTGKPNYETSISGGDSFFDEMNTEATLVAATNNALKGMRVYVSSDYCLSEHFKGAVNAMIRLCGGEVTEEFDAKSVDVYIGKFREGHEYKICLESPSVQVASLRWLYQVVLNKDFIPPLRSNLLHFPIPRSHISEFTGKRISVTGYSGDARHYLSLLIGIMGAEFTKTLDNRNDFLVAEKHEGEKFNAVQKKWPGIKVVNHFWIEQCFASWNFLDPTKPDYGKEAFKVPKIGSTTVKISLLGIQVRNKVTLDVEDSATEECCVESTPVTSPCNKLGEQNGERKGLEEASIAKHSKRSSPVSKQTPTQSPEDVLVLQMKEAQYLERRRSSRSAKQKATLKLHNDMEDLNNYTSMLKSVRKMNTYMKQLEESVDHMSKRKAKDSTEGRDAEDSDAAGEQVKRRKKQASAAHKVVIMTGCEQEITLTRADVVSLSRVGITVANDFDANNPIDAIIAPRVLRTEKFLKCLSQCTQVLHPKYLIAIIKEIKKSPKLDSIAVRTLFPSEDFSLDLFVPIEEINKQLGIKSKQSGLKLLLDAPNKGSVFKDMKLNLSHNLNGGATLIKSILKEHGLSEVKIVKLTSSIERKTLLSDASGRSIIVANKEKDVRAVRCLSSDHSISVCWDWCVKSIFKLTIVEFEEFQIQ